VTQTRLSFGYKRWFHTPGGKWGHPWYAWAEWAWAIYKIKKCSGICENFEKKYDGLRPFYGKIDSGEPGDDDDFFDWYEAKKGLNIW